MDRRAKRAVKSTTRHLVVGEINGYIQRMTTGELVGLLSGIKEHFAERASPDRPTPKRK